MSETARPGNALPLPRLPPAALVLGHALHPVDLEMAASWTRAAALLSHGTRIVVTLNPEIVVRARRDPSLAAALASADLTVADGVGVAWAARRAGVRLPGRVPGIDLVQAVLERGGPELSVFFLGGRPGVAEQAAEGARLRWGVQVAGTQHGYFDIEGQGERVAAQVAASGCRLLLAGLGERQEIFLARHRRGLGAGVAIGVGGTLDVIAGARRRSPAWTRRFGIEWAYRVGLDPRRWHRVPRLITFAAMVLSGGRRTRG